VPVIGTTVGAVLGGVAGGGAAFLTDQEQDRERRRAERTGTTSPELEALQKQNQLLQDQLDALNDIKRGQALPFSDLAGRDQISALLD
jgi:ABC-type phosphate transport system auxiliary subunit